MQTNHSFAEMSALCRDFETFMEYLNNNMVSVSKRTKWISRKSLFQLNELMTYPNPHATANKDQIYYPTLHLLYHLGLSGRMIEVRTEKASKWELRPTHQYETYQQFTLPEKYLFLLETFWVDVDWLNLTKDPLRAAMAGYSIDDVLRHVLTLPVGEATRLPAAAAIQSLQDKLWNIGEFVNHFATFGFWSFEESDDSRHSRKGHLTVDAIQPTQLFTKLVPILLEERPADMWNLSLRAENGEWNVSPGAPYEGAQEWTPVPFFRPFTGLFPEGEVQRTMPREPRGFKSGIYIFKISLTTSIWRKIAIAAQHTVEDLHRAIQQAFQFDDDHLYSFFLDGKKWSHRSVNAPHSDEGPYAGEVLVGDLGLSIGQTILYLFDYGDEWTFDVQLEGIRPDEGRLLRPDIFEKRGKAPYQYPD